MTKQTYFLHGTNCASCEVVIERTLKKDPTITRVNASHTKGCVTIQTKHGQPSVDTLNTLLADHGYRVTTERTDHAWWKKIRWQRLAAVLVFTGTVYIILKTWGWTGIAAPTSNPASLLGVLGIGFLASLSSCTAVIGGLVLAVSSVTGQDRSLTTVEKLRPHVLFHVGRVGGFFGFGAVLGLLGASISLTPFANGLLLLAIALLLITIALHVLDIVPAQVRLMPKWLTHRVHALSVSRHPGAPMVLGAGTFFLPCGFTQSMQLFALTLQDPFQSALVMAVFALGTMPVLLGIGGLASVIRGEHLTRLTQAAGVVMLLLAMVYVGSGWALLGLTMPWNGVQREDAPTSLVNNGRQQITMRIAERGAYEPNVLSVQEGIPVDWEIIGGSFLGCADTLVMPAFGVSTRIKTGKNLVQFTPTKTGSFPFSCSMGMIRGTMIVTSTL